MVGIDFHEFLCVYCDEGLPVVPLDGDESGRSRRGFLTSLRFGCPELVDVSELTLKLSLACGELRGSDLGEQWPGHGGMMAQEEGHCVKGVSRVGSCLPWPDRRWLRFRNVSRHRSRLGLALGGATRR